MPDGYVCSACKAEYLHYRINFDDYHCSKCGASFSVLSTEVDHIAYDGGPQKRQAVPTRDQINSELHWFRIPSACFSVENGIDEQAWDALMGCIAGWVSDEDELHMR